MRRVLLISLALVLLLTGCAGSAPVGAIDGPPNAQPLSESDNAKVNQLIQEWKTSVPKALTEHQIKADSIEQKTYSSTATLDQVAAHYDQLLQKGWTKSQRVTGPQDGVLLTGYDQGNNSVVIGAVDATKLGGTGVVVYTAQGHK